jgi:hypothetical protein
VGGAWSVGVVAVNSVGKSNAGQASGPAPTRPGPDLPTGGADHVTGESIAWDGVSYEGSGTLSLTLAPPADWRTFTGTCRYTISGGGITERTAGIACGATSLTTGVNHGIVRSQDGGQVTHSYTVVFVADNGTGTVSSASHTGTYQGDSLDPTEPVP